LSLVCPSLKYVDRFTEQKAMIKTGKRINSRRVFSEEFKRKVVNEFEKGEMSVSQLSRCYKINSVQIYRWIYKYSSYNEKNVAVVEMKDSKTNRVQELEKKVKELEQIVGQKQIKIDYLEKMIDLAKEIYSIDLKKNSDTQPSGGSRKTPRK
jgi:transposase-like protein